MVVCSNSRRVFKISYSLYVKKIRLSLVHAKFTYILLTIKFILSQKLFEYETKGNIAIQIKLENTDPQL